MPSRACDVVVIGAGPAGEVAAGRLADGGLDVMLVERELVGGECSFWACMPSKALLRPAQALAEAARIPGAAEAVTGAVDVPATLARRDEIVHDLDDAGQMPWIEQHGVTLLRGHGRLAGERTVVVGDEEVTACRAVLLAPGSAALVPPVPGLAEARPWTNREATLVRDVPASLLVLGGGPVGCEMAQAYRSLGAEVRLVEAGEHLLGREEPYAGAELHAAMEEAGIDVRIGIRATAVRRADSGEVTVELDDGTSLVGDEVLCALGRRPLTDDLGLETVGLEPGGAIDVDGELRVPGLDWLYVLGDANGRVLLTHMGKYQARLAADRILGRPGQALRLDGTRSPRVTFTEPQVAAVGLTLAGAREAGHDAFCVEAGTSANAGGSFYGRGVAGTSRLVIERGTDRILGATLVGAEVADFLHAATVAVVAGMSMTDFRHAVPAFPSRSEVWLYLVEAWERAV